MEFVVSDCKNFDIKKTFDSGQCFRWVEQTDGSYIGVVKDKVFHVCQQENKVGFKILAGTDIVDFSKSKDKTPNQDVQDVVDLIWEYFDLGTDYSQVDAECLKSLFLRDACKYSSGIRILKQDPWEMLISYIISQNNNIPRIKKIVGRLCETFGREIICDINREVKSDATKSDEDNKGHVESYYTFPTAEEMFGVALKDLGCLGCGFRDKYIFDAISKIKDREVVLKDLYAMPTQQARETLLKIKGVGPKVADCVLLYGFGKKDCFPIDVWIKKTLDRHFDSKLPEVHKQHLGIVQQYIYYYAKNNNIF